MQLLYLGVHELQTTCASPSLDTLPKGLNKNKYYRFAIEIILLQKGFPKNQQPDLPVVTGNFNQDMFALEACATNIIVSCLLQPDLQSVASLIPSYLRTKDKKIYEEQVRQGGSEKQAAINIARLILTRTLQLAIEDIETLINTCIVVTRGTNPHLSSEDTSAISKNSFQTLHWFTRLHGLHEPRVKTSLGKHVQISQGKYCYDPNKFELITEPPPGIIVIKNQSIQEALQDLSKPKTHTLACPGARSGVIKLLWEQIIEIYKAAGEFNQ